MPPKRKAPVRRGKAAATDDSEHSTTAQPSSSIPGPSTIHAAIVSQDSTNDDSPAHSPNSSPATMPTETPAPTPVRASAPSSSTGVAPGTRGRGGLLGQRGRPVPTSKFKPKAIRRDGAERERLVREENAREAQRLKEEQAEADRLSRGLPRGRGGSGRGARGQYSNVNRSLNASTASGLFSQLPQALVTPASSSSAWGGGYESGPSGTIRVKSEGGHGSGHGGGGAGGGGGGGGATKKAVDFDRDEPDYEDDEDESQRVNVDLLSRDDGGAETDVIQYIRTGGKGKGKGKGTAIDADTSGMMPVRLRRVQPKEKVTVINLESDTKVEEPDLVIDEKPSFTENASENLVRIKSEPGLDDGDDVVVAVPAPPSPESKLKSKPQAGAASTMDVDDTPKKSTHSKSKETEVLLQTEEEFAEYDRHVQELKFLAHSLGRQPLLSEHVNGEPVMSLNEQTGEMEPEKKIFALDGNLFLFQLPPVLPQLYNPLKSSKPISKAKAKAAAAESSPSSSKKPKSSKSKSKEVKEEQVEIHEVLEEAAPELIEEEGHMGKMNVRASGKVEFSWGGTSMLANKGIDSDFLSTAVIVDSRDRLGGQFRDVEVEGIATGMGRIFGKFVLVPDVAVMS